MLGDSGPGWHHGAAEDPAKVHLVLDDGDGPAGYLVLAAPRGPEPGVELHRLAVAAARRRSGLGRGLLRLAMDLSGAPGKEPKPGPGRSGERRITVDPGWDPPRWLAAGRIWLEVAPGNTPALRLYRAAGLVTETRLSSVPGDPDAPPLRLVLTRG